MQNAVGADFSIKFLPSSLITKFIQDNAVKIPIPANAQ